MKNSILALFICFSLIGFSQSTQPANEKYTFEGVEYKIEKDNKNSFIVNNAGEALYINLTTMPEFPGGQQKMMEFIGKNTTYPAKAKANNISGKVYVSFVVAPDGSISNTNVIKSVDPLLDDEAIRVVKSMPKWTPGKVNGENVPVIFTLPFSFTLK